MTLFDNDSDNSIVYDDMPMLFYDVITLVAGAAIISRQIRTHTFFYVMICHLHGICRYEKISCYFISCIVMFEKCKNLVYMNDYGTECKPNISAYRFWPNKSIIRYFIHECLILLMKGMHKTRCIYLSEPPRLKLQWRHVGYMAQYPCICLFSYLSNLTWTKILITEIVWLFIRYGSHSCPAVLRYGPQPVALRFTHVFLNTPRAWKQNRIGAI